MLSREQILAVDDLRRIVVDVPAWGGAVGLRVMTAGEQDWFGEFVGTDATRVVPHLRETLVAMCLCDDQGGRLFSTDEVAALAAKSSEIIKRLFDQASELNGLRPEALETETKNSARLPGDASGITLPSCLEDAVSANGRPSLTPENAWPGKPSSP